MPDADDLLRLATLGADALDSIPRLEATIAGLEHTRDDQAALIAEMETDTAALQQLIVELRAQIPKARFPGDPGTGRMWWGAAVGGNAAPTAHETAAGQPLPIRRRYYTASQWGPAGALVKAATEDHAANRLPWMSFKVNWADAAAGKLDAQFDALIVALENLDKPTWLIINHEPENDGGNAADWRALQRRFRARLDAHGPIKRISFGGCLMWWTFDPTSKRKPDDWWPGDHVWDWLGNDYYIEPSWAIDHKWPQFMAYAKAKGIPVAVPEWGIRRTDPNGAARMRAFYDLLVASGCVAAAYFDSNLNSTLGGWALAGPGLVEFDRLVGDGRTARL